MPAPLRIDFVATGDTADWKERTLLICGVIAVLGVIFAHHELQVEISEVEAQARANARRLVASGQPASADPSKARALSARITASNRVLDALDQPWSRLFEDIEGAASDGIALLALEPDAAQRSVRLSGEAQDLDALSQYLERLGALASLRDVRITQHELREGKGQPVLRFTVSARWVRAT